MPHVTHGCLRVTHFMKFAAQCFTNPQYELVALHPDHFLPKGRPLIVYDSATREHKSYVAATDQCLRETVDPQSPPFPPFYLGEDIRENSLHPNVCLVALNAQIKFRRYLEMVQAQPPPTPLPQLVLSLIDRTIELVQLLYWKPAPKKGSKGEKVLAAVLSSSRKKPPRSSRADQGKTTEGSSKKRGRDTEMDPPGKHQKFADMDLEARIAYGMMLMSGHGMLPLSMFTNYTS
jgi:hypothetical protein